MSVLINSYIPLGCVPSVTVPRTDAGSITYRSEPDRALTVALQLLVERQVILIKPSLAHQIARVYALPKDVARSVVDRSGMLYMQHWSTLLLHLDTRREAWLATSPVFELERNYSVWATSSHESLFYMFNTLHSPDPLPSSIPERHTRRIVERLLDAGQRPVGIVSEPYPYQRRSAATMIERECSHLLQNDPRLEQRFTPMGDRYWYCPADLSIYSSPALYDRVKGGILAETMGLGKTLICLCAIMHTRGQLPQPPAHLAPIATQTRTTFPTLAELAASAILGYSIPWKAALDEVAEEGGLRFEACERLLEMQQPYYEQPSPIARSARRSNLSRPATKVWLSSATVLVVPRNLLMQWLAEIDKHLVSGSLKVLVMDDADSVLPEARVLIRLDLIIFSLPRFRYENRQTVKLYKSPLRSIRFLRLIVDEGQGFSSTHTDAFVAAERIVSAERRWIVSGTPAKDLLGIEVEQESLKNSHMSNVYMEQSLLLRKKFDWVQEHSSGAAKSIGLLVSHFLKAHPWAMSAETQTQSLAWDDCIYRHEDLKLKTFSGYSQAFQQTLSNIVVRTQPFDVQKDLTLPPLHHRVVRLQPTLFDRLTANLFVLLFTTNEITSERADQDYLFHHNSAGQLASLLTNLRQSTVSWTGFDNSAIVSSIEVAEKYAAKDVCTAGDRLRLKEAVEAARFALDSVAWNSLKSSHDIGLALENWPSGLHDTWALSGFAETSCMTMLSLSMVQAAQDRVDGQLDLADPLEGMEGLGLRHKIATVKNVRAAIDKHSAPDMAMHKAGISDATFKMRATTPKKLVVKSRNHRKRKHDDSGPDARSLEDGGPQFASAAMSASCDGLRKIRCTGTTSAKLSYLMTKIEAIHETEKIIVFFEGNHVAFYISQALDVLQIKHLIYGNVLTGHQRSSYVVLFNTDESQRVLLMDIKQAARGLDISSASRVFFVTPTCRPDIEAQAIKRAHRIGQNKSVQVETLLLRGTVEEKIYDRSVAMTKGDHLMARTLQDDEGIRGILQGSRVVPIDGNSEHSSILATIEPAQQLFGRSRRMPNSSSKLEDELFRVRSGHMPR